MNTNCDGSDNSKKQARRWCFTWNNYPDDQGIIGDFITKSKCTYYVIGCEVAPTTGTPHLQGYMEFGSGMRLATLKKLNNSICWMICNGTQEQNKAYCSKAGKWFEGGTPAAQGERTDLTEIRTMIQNGGSMIDVANASFGNFVRYNRGFQLYRDMLDQQQALKWRDVNISYWWGSTGSGKTRRAMTEDPFAYIPMNGPTGMWWTGYNNQSTVIFDDFRGIGVQLHVLLRWLDGYPVQVPRHGGATYLTATRIIITSNVSLESLYPGSDQATRDALKRRITDIVNFDEIATEVGGNISPHISP